MVQVLKLTQTQIKFFSDLDFNIADHVLHDIDIDLAIETIQTRYGCKDWAAFYTELQSLLPQRTPGQILCLKSGLKRVFTYYEDSTRNLCLLQTFNSEEKNPHTVNHYLNILKPKVNSAVAHGILPPPSPNHSQSSNSTANSLTSSPTPHDSSSGASSRYTSPTDTTHTHIEPYLDDCLDLTQSLDKNTHSLETLLDLYKTTPSKQCAVQENIATYLQMTI